MSQHRVDVENVRDPQEKKLLFLQQPYLVHVRKNEKAQLLPHVHRVHCKIVFQLGDWDESVQLKANRNTHTKYYLNEYFIF